MKSIVRTLTVLLAATAAGTFLVALGLDILLEYSNEPFAARCLTATRMLKDSISFDVNGKMSVAESKAFQRLESRHADFWFAASMNGQIWESDPSRRPRLPFDLRAVGIPAPEKVNAPNLCLDVEHIGEHEVTMMLTGFHVSLLQFTLTFLQNAVAEIMLIGFGFGCLVAVGTLVSASFVSRSLKRVTELALSIDPRAPNSSIALDTVPIELVALISALNRCFDEINAFILRQRRFIGNAAHELRTPLTLLRAKVEDVPIQPLKSELMRDLRRLGSLVSAMLDLAQLQANAIEMQVIDIGKLVQEVLADLAPSAMSDGIELSLENLCSRPFTVRGVEAALRSAIANIVGNALLHAKNAKTVVVCITRTSIIITDDGIGIIREEGPSLIQPFRKGAGSSGSAGLGLSIVMEIMSLHQGTIDVSPAEGGGTRVTLAFKPSNAPDADWRGKTDAMPGR
jgi:signal transduction histidine kinase